MNYILHLFFLSVRMIRQILASISSEYFFEFKHLARLLHSHKKYIDKYTTGKMVNMFYHYNIIWISATIFTF